jgi:hypothetical protein
MLNAIELLLYLFLAFLWYQTDKFVSNKKNVNASIDNDILIKYNNNLNEYYYNECSYKNKSKGDDIDYVYDNSSYEYLWINNVENGFSIVRTNNITITGYKQNNLYDGLVRIDGAAFADNKLKYVDCLYENGVQKTCFVIDKNNSIKLIMPENVVVAL